MTKESICFDSLHKRMSIYFYKMNNNLPILINTRASYSITLKQNDFIKELTMSEVSDLKGLSHTEHVVAKVTVYGLSEMC